MIGRIFFLIFLLLSSSALADFRLFSGGNFKKADGSGGGWGGDPVPPFKTLEECSKEGERKYKELQKFVLKEGATLDQAEIYCRDLGTQKDTIIIKKTN
jgi:hypothetical protein